MAQHLPPSRTASVKTAVIGASGFIGHHLWRTYRAVFPDVLGTAFSASRPELTFFDIRQPVLDFQRLEEQNYRAVLISSAKPNISFCEREQQAAYAVNVRGTLELIRQIGRTSLQVIFLSSDYVFDGTASPYDDAAAVQPNTEYGRQKALVETELPSYTDNYLILRLSKIFGIQKHDGTLLDEMASTLSAGRDVRAATDQVFCPTFVEDLIHAILAIQSAGLRGTLNVCGSEAWSRHDIAVAMARALPTGSTRIKPVHLHDLPGMSGRPLNTSLTCRRLANEVDVSFSPLSEMVDKVAANWRSQAHDSTS